MFLLDTMVLSELAKPERRQSQSTVRWLRAAPPQALFVSVVTIGEIERGVELERPSNPSFAARLAAWLDETLRSYEGRLLPFDVPEARRWGRLSAMLGNDQPDLQIAATALERGLTVVTRNVSHFTPAGVDTLNPYTA